MKLLVGFFDRLIYKFIGNSHLIETKVNKENLKKRFYYVKNSKILYVNILGWHACFSNAFPLKNHLNKKGISCVMYEFPCGILSYNSKLTESNFLKLNKIIKKDIEDYKSRYNFDEIIVSGTSLGGILAFLVSNGNKLVNKLVLIVPGYDLAESLWFGIVTRKLRKRYEKNNVNLKKLMSLWKSITPYKNFDKLDDKKIFIFASKSDRVINFSQVEKLCKEFKKRKYNFKCYFNKFLGHYLTIFFTYRRLIKKLKFV
ncbi:MAG: prolyl oligopeptidase family serine peptidase [Candidatus Pacearchaeota archaeon]|jgi:esterase/lipase